MRTLPLIGALALLGMAIPPAAAQMCAPGQQVQATTPAQWGSMMCGGMGAKAPDDPMADKPAEKPKMSGMCPCCSGMAMMRGGGMQHEMPMAKPKP
jgi:hypothetical protein